MARMPRQPNKPIEEVVAEVGRYPIEAYEFIREGLAFTVERIHGKETPAEQRVYQLMQERDLNLEDIEKMHLAGELPEPLAKYVAEHGGVESLNRHVSGEQLCLGLRDYARKRWGLLAGAVLRGWNITSTDDFGRIIFALVENAFLRKEPDDRIEDFHNVYGFDEAFDQSYEIGATDE